MSKSDYIMLMIEQLSIFISQIIGLKQENRLEESQLLLNNALTQLLGLNSQLADVLSYPDLIGIISGGEGLKADKCMVLAELLKLKADIYQAQDNQTQADNLYFKSMNLFIEVLSANDHLRSATNILKIDEIIQRINVDESPEESKYLLFQYYEQTGRFDRAENLLFNWLESKPYASFVIEKGLAFYQRLMNLSEMDLLQGNLPLPEVMESYRELCDIRNSRQI